MITEANTSSMTIHPTESTAIPMPQNSEPLENKTANVASRPTPSPNQDVQHGTVSSKKFYSNGTMEGDFSEHSCFKIKEESFDDVGVKRKTASSEHMEPRKASNASIISTPSPLKRKQAFGSTSCDGTLELKQGFSTTETEGEGPEVFSPKAQASLLADPVGHASADLTLSNFSFYKGSDGFLSDALVETPNPVASTNSMDFNSFGHEVHASVPALPNYAHCDLHAYGDFSDHETYTASGNIDMTQYLVRDAFALPPYLQAYLDETHAASNVLIQNNDKERDGRDGNVFFQVTSCRQKISTPGRTPPAVCGSSGDKSFGDDSVDSDKENMIRAVANNSKKQAKSVASKSKKISTKSKARPLPLRKRPIQEKENESEESTPVQKKKSPHSSHPLPPQNSRWEHIDRVTCKCAKSKCLKLYCDCFQQGKVCIGRCSCLNCKNTIANSGPDGVRTKAIQEILARRPDAFERREKKTDDGCACKKNK